jgi:hypothetical protein
MVQEVVAPYPVLFDADYPERQSRWKALFRLPLAIPALFFATLAFYVALLALFPMWLAILIRGRIPRWLFDFQVGVNRFSARVQAYFSLLTDVYPAFDGEYPVRYAVAYPGRVSRLQLVIWKFAASLPQWFAVWILQYAAFALVSIGWLVILFTGRFPKELHTFVVGVMRWRERVFAYSLSLTDEYPPYSLSAEAPAARGTAYVLSSGVGALAVGGLVAGLVALIVTAPYGGEEKVVDVSYSRLVDGELARGEAELEVNLVAVELVDAIDPANEAFGLYEPQPGYKLVLFSFFLTNQGDTSSDNPYRSVWGDDFRLDVGSDELRYPLIAVVDRLAPPVRLAPGERVAADVVFEVPASARPAELLFDRKGFFSDVGIFRFR